MTESVSSTPVSQVKQALSQYHTEMTLEELHGLIMVVKRAANEDEHSMRSKLQEMTDNLMTDLSQRDQRDARLQHHMHAHNIPLDEHIANYRRVVDNLNSLYQETFGNPREYDRGRKLVEQTPAYQRMVSG